MHDGVLAMANRRPSRRLTSRSGMYLMATSSPVVLSRISCAVPKAPDPSSRTCAVSTAAFHEVR